MALKIFPYVLVRYASMPFPELDALHIPGLQACITAMDQLETALAHSKAALCDELYITIKAQEDDKRRQRLLQLKRDIYNDKVLAIPEPVMMEAGALYPALQAHLQLNAQKHQLLQEWNHTFDNQVIHQRKQLQAWTQQELLRSGILLSSPVLYGQLDSFAAADPSAFRNRELKNEYSLLRYITRMACKTSPFSTFTYTGIGTLSADQQAFQQRAEPHPINSGIRLNNSLFAYIRSLMIHHPVMNEILEVRLNTTATVNGEHLSFLVNYFNVEAFQRLPARNLPLWLFNFLQEHPAPVTTGALIDILAQHIPDTDRESIKTFLLKLAASGFLELGIGCSGVDPAWDTALTGFLATHMHRHAAIAALHQQLQSLAHRKVRYAGASSLQRHQLLQETTDTLNHLLCTLQEEAGLPTVTAAPADAMPAAATMEMPASFEVNRFAPRYFAPQDIFYEDAFTKEDHLLPEAAIHAFTSKADQLCTLLEPMDALQEERQRMRDFFLQHYGPSHEERITAFYHAYYLHEKKQAQERRQGQDDPVLKAAVLPDTMQLAMDPLTINIRVPVPVVSTSGKARGMFVQFYNSLQNGIPVLHGVINALLPGMGKVAGRFLHLFDPAITHSFREWNTALHPAHMLMELNDGSTFNANIHPPLLPYEIGMPGGNNNYPVEGQVSLKDVLVKYNAEKELLLLYHASDGREIYAYDLCLESFYNRSNFYQLLAHFNPGHALPLRKLVAAADKKHAAVFAPQEDVQLKPRIIFEEQLILRRRGWLVKTGAVPAPLNGETDAAYFVRLHNWREQQQLPEHVFLFLKSPYIVTTPDQKSKLQRDDYKPQYICFTQPLLVTLLRKLLSRAGAWCYLEEMLPHAGHLRQPEAGNTVTEYMLHWYKY